MISNVRIFDGSGAPGRLADVAISDGVITIDRYNTPESDSCFSAPSARCMSFMV